MVRNSQVEISEEELAKEAYSIFRIYEKLQNKYEWSGRMYLNLDILRIAVESYLHDLYRFSDYHGSEFADNHKRGAYIIKWISKLRPVHFFHDQKNLSALEYLSNNILAVFAGLGHLQDVALVDVSDRYFDHLFYTSLYRNIDGLQLASTFYVLEKALQKKNP